MATDGAEEADFFFLMAERKLKGWCGMYSDTLENRKRAILENAQRVAGCFLDRAKDGKSYECPKCGRGGKDSKHRDGLSIDYGKGGLFHCFSGDCGFSGSNIIDLYMGTTGKSFGEAVDELERLAGTALPIEPAEQEEPKKSPAECIAEHEGQVFEPMPKEWRGISAEIYNQHGARFCRRCKNPKIAGTYNGARPAVSFPLSGGGYFVRAVRDMPIGDGAGHERCNSWEVGNENGIFNAQALQSDGVVIVAESCIDALSFLTAGYNAVGLTGASKGKALLEVLANQKSRCRLLVALDNDKTGQDRQGELVEAVKTLGIECMGVDTAVLYAGLKDANEALVKDRQGFSERLRAVVNRHPRVATELLNPWAGGVTSLIGKVQDGCYLPIATGIAEIDRLTGGGFINQQLIGITGRPGAGKTAFCQWLVENMAINKEDFSAVYLCFEMSTEQLQARSISRLMHEAGENLTPLEVLQGKGRWLEGAQMYESLYSDKVLYMGMGGGLQSNDIEEVERVIGQCMAYKQSKGEPMPIVVCDYLQIIKVAGMNEFEAVGTVMARLKGLAVQYNTVILLVIANNRESNKKAEFDMFSGRGSGSIEYGLDAMLSLVPDEEAKEIISLNVAKGRWINPDGKAVFEFNGASMAYTMLNAIKKPIPMSTKEAKVAQDLFDGVGKK